MSIAAKANKVCKSMKKPMSIPSKTRKDQKAHEHSSNPCQKVLKPMSMATKTQKRKPRPEEKQEEEMLEWRPPALTNTPPSHAHTASPRPLARTHDTNTKRNRNQFPDWGSPASIIPLNLRLPALAALANGKVNCLEAGEPLVECLGCFGIREEVGTVPGNYCASALGCLILAA
jgi:hypothetical protein